MSSEQRKKLLSSIDYWLYIRKNRRRSAWNGFVRFMACLVVFCTTYALILPAITLEYQTICGIEEHSHDDSCYKNQAALICGMEESDGHSHTQELCYQTADTLTCGIEEVIEHSHIEGCFHTKTTLICGLEEIIEHIHAEECFDEESELICQLEEIICHTHDVNCYDPEDETKLICELEEIIEHTHSGECHTAETSQVCTLEEIAVHAHAADCFDADGNLACTLEEITAHSHTDTCYTEQSVFVCEQDEIPAHAHSDECSSNISTLVCTITEHIHSSECFPSEEDSGAILLNPLSTLLMAPSNTATTSGETIETKTATEESSYPIMPTALDDEIKISGSGAVFDPNTGTYTVDLRLDFELTAQEIEANGYNYSITLPENVIIPEKILGVSGIAADTTINNMIAFDYEFASDTDCYKVIVKFREDYVAALAAKGNAAEASVYVSFEGKLDEDTKIQNGTLVLEGGDGTVTNIPVTPNTFPDNQTNQYDISTNKTGSYNTATNELTYTITISSSKGTPSDVVVEDLLSQNGIEISNVTDLSITKNGSTVTPKTSDKALTADSNGWMLTLDRLSADESYTITYTYKLSDIADNATYYPYNRVTATSTDPNDSTQTVTSSSSISNSISKQLLSKNGSFNAETNQITWTITVNTGGNNIAGYTLTDDMLSNAQSLSIVPGAGFVIDDSNGYAITFTGTNDDGTNTNTYTIVYTTEQQQSSTTANVVNKAVLDNPNDDKDPSESTHTAYVPAGGSITKTAGTINAADGTMSWTLTFNIPNGGIPATTYDYWGNPSGYISDNTGPSWGVDTSHWFSKDQRSALYTALSEALPGVNFELQFSTNNNTWVSYDSIAEDSTTKYHCYRITFPEGLAATAVANQQLTFTYSTTADLSNVSSATFANTAKFDNGSSTAEQKYTNSIAKMDRYYRTGNTYISNTDGVIGWYIRVTPGADASTIVVEDTLPEGLNLLRLGVGSDGNAASSCYGYTPAYSGTVTGWDNLSGAYEINNRNIKLTITKTSNENTLPANAEVYVYVECQIDDLPTPGESKEYRFANTANITIDNNPQGDVTQTQIVTVNRPAAIVKMDSNVNASDTTNLEINEDGTVGWYVQLYLDTERTGPINVTDNLPDGVTLSKIGIGSYASTARSNAASNVVSNNPGTLNNDGFTGTYTITTDNSKQTVNVNIGDSNTTFAANSYIYLYLECNLSSDLKATGGTLTNTATMDSYSDSQTQVLTPPKVDVVSKTSIWNTNINQIKYEVVIDGRGTDGQGLLPGTDDTIDVKDVMSYWYNPWYNTIHSTLIASSVKLYYATPIDGGGYSLGEELQPNDWSWTFADGYLDLNGNQGTMTNTITATVPDGHYLVLTYSYAIKIDTNSNYAFNYQVSNSVSLEGQAEGSDQVYDNFEWDISEVDAGITSSGTYTITKVQRGNYGMTLPGAQFSVYKYQDDSPVMKSDGTAAVYTSDEDGKIYISSEEWYEKDVVYYFVETQAPAGYALPENPTRYHFYFKNNTNPTNPYLPSGTIDLTNDFGIAYIENEIPVEKVHVEKVWQDSDGKEIGAPSGVPSISFRLYQNGILYDATPDDTMDADTVYPVSSVGVDGTAGTDDDWTLDITDLPVKDESGTPYVYTIEEIEVEGYSSAISVNTTTDGFFFTITNQKEASSEITVEKKWKNTDDANKDPVTVQLYQVEGEIYADYTAYLNFVSAGWGPGVTTDSAQVKEKITGPGTYTLTWNLDATGHGLISGAETFYIDIFDPSNKAFAGYSVSDVSVTIDGETKYTTPPSNYIFHEGQYFRITFYNSTSNDLKDFLDPTQIQIAQTLSVTFTLSGNALPDLDYETDTPISGGTPYGEPVAIGTDGTWTHTWTDLPINGVNANGEIVSYTYYVVETTTGYNTLYSTSRSQPGGSTITITNEYIPPVELPYSVSLQVDKQWHDSNGKTYDAPPLDAVEFDLYRQESVSTNTVKLHWGTWGGGNTTTITVPEGGTITLQFVAPDYYDENDVWMTIRRTDSGIANVMTQHSKSDWLGYTRQYGIDSNGNHWANYRDTYRYTYDITVSGGDAEFSISFYAQSAGEKLWTKESYSNTWPEDWTNDTNVETELGIESITVSEDEQKGWVNKGTFTITADEGWSKTLENLEPGEYKIVEKTTGKFVTTYTVGGDPSADPPVLTLENANKSGYATIINTVATADLTVNKVWRDNQSTSRPLFLTFTLYQNDNFYQNFRLTNSNNWSTTISDLPIYDNDGHLYTYKVVESALSGYKTTYAVDNGAPNPANATLTLVTAVNGNAPVVTVTNELVTELEVQKEWFEGMTPADVKIQLYQVLNGNTSAPTKYGEEVTLGPGGETDWKKTYRDLPLYAFDQNGNVTGTYTYYVEETTTGYTTTYSAVDADGNAVNDDDVTTSPVVSGGTITITNAPPPSPPTSIIVEKEWLLPESVDINLPTSITFKLYQHVTANGTTTKTQYGDTPYTLPDEKGNWFMTIDDLPSADVYGNPYTYTVEEESVDPESSFIVHTYRNNDGITSGTITIVNEPATKITVYKDWAEGMTPEEIQIQLYQVLTYTDPNREPTVKAWTIDTMKLETIDGVTTTKHKTFKNHPLYAFDDAGNMIGTYSYYVKELTPGYYVTYSNGDDPVTGGEITITNWPATTINVQKEWKNADGSAYAPSTEIVKLKLMQVATPTSGEPTTVEYAEIELSTEKGWTYSFADLPTVATDGSGATYTYYVVEENGNVYGVTYTGSDGTTVGAEKPVSSGTITVTNKVTSLTVNKVWKDALGNVITNVESGFIQFHLYQNGTILDADPNDDEDNTPYTLAPVNGEWSMTIEGLPYTDSDGTPYNYTVEEVPVEGYNSYVSNSGSTITITNKEIAETEITVQKIWKDSNGNTLTDYTDIQQINYQLYQITTPVASVSEVSAEDKCMDNSNLSLASESTTDTVSFNATFSSWGTLSTSVEKPRNTVVTLIIKNLYGYENRTITHVKVNNVDQPTPVPTTEKLVIPWDSNEYTSVVYTYSFTLDDNTTLDAIMADGTISFDPSEYKDWTVLLTYTEPSTDPDSGDGGSGGSGSGSTDPWIEPDGGVKFGDSRVLYASNGWTDTITDLPLYEYDADGNVTGYYSYYIKEAESVSGNYVLVGYNNNNGITSGTITVTNKLPSESPGYELPSTGGSGTEPLTLGGLAMFLGAAYLLYADRKRKA